MADSPATLNGVSITSFGAIGDGSTLNTASIQAAITHLAVNDGGTLVIPEGVFLTGALFLKPGVQIHLEAGAVLLGSTDIRHYPKGRTRIEGQFVDWIPALINADGCDGLRITGAGTLDGNGQFFYDAFWNAREVNPKVTNLAVERPRLAFIQNSDDVQISGIKFQDSGFWNLHLYRCTNVLVEKTSFKAPYGVKPDRGPSTDAIDIDSCQSVTVHGCFFAVNDDAVCLKGTKGPFALEDTDSPPVENIRVDDCTFEAAHGVITCGSEATTIRDVVVENCRITGKIPLVRLKLRPDTPQCYEDIHFRDITLIGENDAHKDDIFEVEPWTQFFDLQGQQPPSSVVKNITVTGLKGTFGSLGSLRGNPGQTSIRDITLQDLDLQLKSANFAVGEVENLKLENVTINGEPFSLEFAPPPIFSTTPTHE